MAFDKTKAVRAAEKFLAQNKIPAAIQEYRQIVQHDHDDINALNTLGDLYWRVDKKDEAVKCFKRVADHYREQGFALKAIAMYKKITRFNPGTPEIATTLATLYEQQGLIVDARAQYLTVADAYARRGQNREALEVLRRVADLDPNNTQIRLRLAESLLQEKLPDLAVEAFIEAGQRLISRSDHHKALSAFARAHILQPHHHEVLEGLFQVHAVLGTPHEAAKLVAQAVTEHPGDLELRIMLARVHIEAGNASEAESVVQELISQDAGNYRYFFDVARLYLQKNRVNEAVSILSRIVEPALSGREEDTILELLQEAVTRNPEQIDALRLQARIHAWQRDDDRLRVALENLAEISQSLGLVNEERNALTQLVLLSPLTTHYRQRLETLGGALEETSPPLLAPEQTPVMREVPTFESFMSPDETFASPDFSASNSVSETTRFEPVPAFELESQTIPPLDTPSEAILTNFNEIEFEPPGAEASEEQAGSASSPSLDPRRLAMLQQELESVDYYLAQGYTDIAHDTLEMLERQYGAQVDIAARRTQLADEVAPETTPSVAVTPSTSAAMSPPPAVPETIEFTDFSQYDIIEEPPPVASHENLDTPDFEMPLTVTNFATDASPVVITKSDPNPAPLREGSIDPGLAAIFDEFREAVEEPDEAADGDYETHYNLGLAYKDMELVDQAIEEFQKAIGMTKPRDTTSRYLLCCNMLGHCFSKQGNPRLAAMWFKKGLEAPGYTEDEYQALRYELGNAYEQMGDLKNAIDTFNEVYGIDVSYRGVAHKLRELQEHKAVTREG